ncbi:U3 small nucleolar ribonucleoprotein complex, subunit Mpp10 [Phyllosticta citrichinensis]|uniref:U3 small nucleolar ribonucleoprotein protein MPP10 n=1 Tax=Phyllosticta citrichinensis TaxID=1130410 RepID=A0ABR1Y379_9PEZI
MATISFSPTGSSSSHTLSAQSAHPPVSDANSAAAHALVAALSASPHDFLQPSSALHHATLSLAKHLLDPLASGVSETQSKRQQEARKKRKRGEADGEDGPVLNLKKVHLDGFGVQQVWEQSKRVIDATRTEVERDLPDVVPRDRSGYPEKDDIKSVRFGADGFEVGSSDDEEGEQSDVSALREEGVDWEYDGEDVSDEEGGVEQTYHTEDEGSEEEDVGMDRDIFDDEDGDEDGDSGEDEPAEEYVPDPNGLNDGFFSIDDFNRQSELLEQQDRRGADDEEDEEEEDINWGEDPMNPESLVAKASKKVDNAEGDESSEDDEDGPTFGNVDLNAPEGESDDDMDDDVLEGGEMEGMDMGNANNILYDDFFAPPAKKVSKNKKGRPNPHNFPAGYKKPEAPKDEDVERNMAAAHRDLFDESDADSDASDLSAVDSDDPKSRKSTHERRQAKLQEEIRRLEAQNVAKRQWTLSGEAKAADRPMNSLLEEELDYERTGKPVPVITAEVSEDIEALIKRRILAREFDEVIRRRPDDLATGPSTRRGRFELDDTKPQKSLAEEYEDDALRANDPNYVDPRDEKLKKEHASIAALWRDVSAKLDALSSWHHKPKPATASLEIRTDAPTISMEDARPSAGGDIGGSTALAPQEVYAPGEERAQGEVVTKGGLPVAREEMTREEKLRRRRRDKERAKKAGAGAQGAKKNESKTAKNRREVVSDLKKGGVKVIGKKGEMTDVEGKKVKDGQQAARGVGGFKL